MNDDNGSLETKDGVVLATRHWPAADPWAAMVVVHGAGEHSGRWSHVGEFFSLRGIDVHLFDLRGHGRSGGKRVHVDDFDTFGDDVQLVVEAKVLPLDKPWVLYGHSLGGLICTGYLLDDRPMPSAAVLSAPGLDDNLPRYLHVAGDVLGSILPGISVPNSFTAEQLSRDPAVGEAYFADPLVETKATLGIAKAGFAEQKRVTEECARIFVPTFVIHGAEDPLVPPSASAPLANSPAVERKLYPGLRHEVHNEPEQEQVLGDVYDWIRATLVIDEEGTE